MRIDERLAEVGFGAWEGRTAAELEQAEPNRVFELKLDPLGRRPEGAEPLENFARRVAAAYEGILD